MRRPAPSPTTTLPVYTVLVPAYREPEVIARLVERLERLEYPTATAST